MYCYGGILHQIIIVIPTTETLLSTIKVHRTLWVGEGFETWLKGLGLQGFRGQDLLITSEHLPRG